jgi:AcrR family transcriptional regulator
MELIERIKEKAFQRYKKHGFRSVTLDDIAQELGISKKTIYTFFTDKDSLVDAILIDQLAYNERCCMEDKKNAQNAIHEIFLALQMMQKTMADMNPTFLYELKKYHYTSYLKFEKFKNEFLYNVIKENLERGIKEELYRPSLNTEIITAMRLENMMMVFNDAFVMLNRYDVITVEEQLLEHFLYGVASPKGYKLILKYKEFLTKNEIVKQTNYA